jgi:putative endonuclease
MAGPLPQIPVVYILRCSDGGFSSGLTENLTASIDTYKAGTGSTCTAARRPVELVFREAYTSLDSTAAR